MKKLWKPIPSFPNYVVNNLGEIKSIKHYVKHPLGGNRLVRERILQASKLRTGYMMVSLGKGYNVLVHRIVAIVFLANPFKKPCVNHLDGNKENNRVNNLQWCSYSENEQWSYSRLNKQSWCKGKKLHYPVWNKGKRLPQISGKNHPNYKHGRFVNQGHKATEQEQITTDNFHKQEEKINTEFLVKRGQLAWV